MVSILNSKHPIFRPSLSTLAVFIAMLGLAFNVPADNPDRNAYQSYDFHPPLDIPLLLSGNFCELRPNHFHTGLDIKTQGVEGKKIYSIEEGYISRIKVSHWGYGKALYVRHPNGYTSVYAHMQRFNDEIEAFLEKAQYEKETYEIELFPGSTQLRVQKGEVIGRSGNSGSSLAPHLHFEIRETKTEHPVDPLLFTFKIQDDIPPTIKNFRVYPLSDSSYVNKKDVAKTFKTAGGSGRFRPASEDTIKVHGEIGFAVEVIDKLNGARNPCGIYTIELFVDDEQVYGQRLDNMDFAVNRYMNAHTDYEQFRRNKRHFQRSFLLPNNKLPIYENVKNRGIVKFLDNKVHHIKYIIKDTYGNTSTLKFAVKSIAKANHSAWKSAAKNFHQLLKHNRENSMQVDGFQFFMPPNLLYDDLPMTFEVAKAPSRAIAKLFKLHNEWTPLQSYYTVKLKPDTIPTGVKKRQLMVVSIDRNGRIWNEKGKYRDGWISARTRSFGNYTVMIDSIPPVITPKNISKGKDMSRAKRISFKIADNLSGIKKYRGEIDGRWVLFEYDPQAAALWYTFDEHVGPGEHELVLTVKDERGNKKTYKTTFIR